MRRDRKTPHCRFCGFRFRYSGIEHDGEKQYETTQITPWRCENCNAVYELRHPEKPERGYIVLRRPEPGYTIVGVRPRDKNKKRRKR